MRIKKIKSKIALLFLSIGVLSCEVESNESDLKTQNPTSSISKEVEQLVTVDESSNEFTPSRVVSAEIPEKIDFAGEPVNILDLDIRERLDYELTGNMYYHSKMQIYLKRANRWFPMIEKILKEEGLPDDFKYLAIAESSLAQVTSPAGAKGFWQFMSATGKEYDMLINTEIDERYHVAKSTKAACAYLKKAKIKFGNWTAAAASYNMGKTGLQNRMDGQFTEDYYDLRLNNETARYVFRILAIKTIMSNPKEYGFNLSPESLYPPYKTKSIYVDSTIQDVALWSKSLNLNYKIIKKLNPWILKNSIPKVNGRKLEILVPSEDSPLKPMSKYE